MDTSTLEKVETPEVAREFSFHDRCDSCGFQGFVVAQKDDKELIFCGHHGRKHMPGLANKGWNVLDFTSKINESPGS